MMPVGGEGGGSGGQGAVSEECLSSEVGTSESGLEAEPRPGPGSDLLLEGDRVGAALLEVSKNTCAHVCLCVGEVLS